ncbi:cytidylate kinase [Paenibacillus darwinianus]|uniref:Cytidylate kinase n=1 Tax=Paenibacillus darwinianus TaxID=1380763 RepID=A0A9W5S3E5_9BACL|nr:(d)CMP kinase [Paenibacillus darwinianus]EXX91393.1 cytidylate kinase [Paenibacillus darwinianus]EXX92225.1 cytidylate kinase [Paenibacillus darwinianus]EXX92334.1 cytidylate kinase [Paenibacillus darwinianus]
MSTTEQHDHAKRINIAIDGPAGAGKSTVARNVARRFGYLYIDTGAMYRTVTLAALRHGIDVRDEARLEKLVAELDIGLEPGDPVQHVYLNGEDVTEAIRSREVTQSVSAVAAAEAVRLRLAELQRDLAAGKGVVMDGRDIGSHVLPSAELKVFLTASVEQRALRRYKEIGDRQGIPLETLEREIAERDRMDEQRKISPLVRAEDAVLLDSTRLSIDEVVDIIANFGRTKLGEAK